MMTLDEYLDSLTPSQRRKFLNLMESFENPPNVLTLLPVENLQRGGNENHSQNQVNVRNHREWVGKVMWAFVWLVLLSMQIAIALLTKVLDWLREHKPPERYEF